jgi:S-adenosylmethionine:tRNA ribosyltransferase-isomerase
LAGHIMHEERYEVSAETARLLNQAKTEGRRVLAVGTTSLRVLESAGKSNEGQTSARGGSLPATVAAGAGRTRLFVFPPYDFKVVDGLLTNFHLPRSTLLMLVSAFAAPGATQGRELVLAAYREAIRERYRFFSYGDAMLVI